MVVLVMNGLTVYQKSRIADARTAYWDWVCQRCRCTTRSLVVALSCFRSLRLVEPNLLFLHTRLNALLLSLASAAARPRSCQRSLDRFMGPHSIATLSLFRVCLSVIRNVRRFCASV